MELTQNIRETLYFIQRASNIDDWRDSPNSPRQNENNAQNEKLVSISIRIMKRGVIVHRDFESDPQDMPPYHESPESFLADDGEVASNKPLMRLWTCLLPPSFSAFLQFVNDWFQYSYLRKVFFQDLCRS